MRPEESTQENTTIKNLTTQLKAVHPADLTSGIRALAEFAQNEWGSCEELTHALDLLAFVNGKNHLVDGKFGPILKSYSHLLHAVFDDISEREAVHADANERELLVPAMNELERIAVALDLNLYEDVAPFTPCQLVKPQQSSRWVDALACAVAIGGGGLLEVACASQDPWRHFVGALALLLVAAPIWNLATRAAQRRALALTAEPTR